MTLFGRVGVRKGVYTGSNILGSGGASGFTPKDPSASGTKYYSMLTGDYAIANGTVPAIDFDEPFSVAMTLQILGAANTHNYGYGQINGGAANSDLNIALSTSNFNPCICFMSGTHIGAYAYDTLSVGNWYRVVFTYDGSNTTTGTKMYAENTTPTQDQTFNPTGVPSKSISGFALNRRDSTNSPNAYMQVCGWSSELSSDDALAYTTSSLVSESPDLFNYDFEEGSGDTITDIVNGHNLTIDNDSFANQGSWLTVA